MMQQRNTRPLGDDERFVNALMGIAEIAQAKLSPNVISIWMNALEKYGLAVATQAVMKLAIHVRPGKGLPAIADVIELIQPKDVARINDEDEAAVAAARIIGARNKWGSVNNIQKIHEVRKWVGELGWEIVQGNGGWNRLCDMISNDDVPTIKAQFRREGVSILGRARRGDDTPPGIPGRAQPVLELPSEKTVNQLGPAEPTINGTRGATSKMRNLKAELSKGR